MKQSHLKFPFTSATPTTSIIEETLLETFDVHETLLKQNSESSSVKSSDTRMEVSNACSASNTSGKPVTMRPTAYDGADDWEEYISQFEILSSINVWNETGKGLYFASSLSGAARTVLSDLDTTQHRKYQFLIMALARRFGGASKSEMYRAKLESRIKLPDESMSDLARSIKKLTRQSYPNADSNLLETLSLDYFIDALSDTDIRLRLREASLTNITQAETLAVRLEAIRLADKYRNKGLRALQNTYSSYSACIRSPYILTHVKIWFNPSKLTLTP